MHIWSLSLRLALICYTSSVQSQSCEWDSQCTSRKCCATGRCAQDSQSRCLCFSDTDCKSWETCSGGSCYIRRSTLRPVYTINFPTWDPVEPPTYEPRDYYCSWSSDCQEHETCEDGYCVVKGGSGGGFSWSGGRVVGIVVFVIIATIISCLYHLCKRARKPPVLAARNGNVPAPPTGVAAVRGNGHEMQPGTATNTTVVEVEDETPLPPGAPPPYNSLAFDNRQNGNEDLPEQPPPSYDEAVRNAEVPQYRA